MPVVYESGNASNSAHFKPLAAGDPPFVVSFYRSKDHANTEFGEQKYGAADPLYRGEFGFDFFDKQVIAEGLSQHYKVLSGIEREKDEGKKTKKETFTGSYAYLCPYLSIWPPNVDGNTEEKNKKHIVTLYARLEKSSEYNNVKNLPDNLDVKFVSTDDQIITVKGKVDDRKPEYIVNLKLEETLVPITIECKKPFGEEKEVAILAKTRYKKEGSMDIVGKVVLYPNAIRYKTIIQPVKVKLDRKVDLKIDDIPHIPMMEKLLKAFNTLSFNQAYMHAKLAEKTKVITLKRKELADLDIFTTAYIDGKVDSTQTAMDYDEKEDTYNEVVESGYAALIAQSANGDKVDKAKLERDRNEKALALVEKFKKRCNLQEVPSDGLQDLSQFKALKRARRKNKVTDAWNHPKVQKALREYEQAQAAWENNKTEKAKLDKTHKIHIFYTEDIYSGMQERTKNVFAYGPSDTGVCHVFEIALNNTAIIPTLIHEIGHSLGLGHPFDEKARKPLELRQPNIVYKKDIGEKIKKLKKDIEDKEDALKQAKKYQRAIDSGELSVDDILSLKALQFQYYLINRFYTRLADNINNGSTGFAFIEPIYEAMKLENEATTTEGTIMTLAQKRQEITKMEGELQRLEGILEKGILDGKPIPELEILPALQKQTETLENYMDYNNKEKTNEVDTNVERKVFYKWEWDKLRETGDSMNYFEAQH
ncbi:hypothetical protein [Bernardetia sp. MNP-M8]|uniref:hypothetical protein n=1 Tax=Bernardetia sp. MNP-M8 TaxID=3127470 RepID=UPI0030D5D4E1